MKYKESNFWATCDLLILFRSYESADYNGTIFFFIAQLLTSLDVSSFLSQLYPPNHVFCSNHDPYCLQSIFLETSAIPSKMVPRQISQTQKSILTTSRLFHNKSLGKKHVSTASTNIDRVLSSLDSPALDFRIPNRQISPIDVVVKLTGFPNQHEWSSVKTS